MMQWQNGFLGGSKAAAKNPSVRSGILPDFDGAIESKVGRGTLCEVFLLASGYFQPISGMFSFPFKRVEAETMR